MKAPKTEIWSFGDFGGQNMGTNDTQRYGMIRNDTVMCSILSIKSECIGFIFNSNLN